MALATAVSVKEHRHKPEHSWRVSEGQAAESTSADNVCKEEWTESLVSRLVGRMRDYAWNEKIKDQRYINLNIQNTVNIFVPSGKI